jgi:RNA polymerase sigma-70 factor (ECF subfamily)
MSMSAQTEWLQCAVAGDREALSRLLRELAPAIRARLRGSISPKWQSAFDLDDVLQVTYVEAFMRIREFQIADAEPVRAFEGWLVRSAQNNIRDAVKWLERDKRPPAGQQPRRRADEAQFGDMLETITMQLSTPSQRASRAEAVRLLERAFDRVPADYARVVRLYDLEQAPAEAVAARIGRSVGAMYMLRARALTRLRELLGSTSDFFPSSP